MSFFEQKKKKKKINLWIKNKYTLNKKTRKSLSCSRVPLLVNFRGQGGGYGWEKYLQIYVRGALYITSLNPSQKT